MSHRLKRTKREIDSIASVQDELPLFSLVLNPVPISLPNLILMLNYLHVRYRDYGITPHSSLKDMLLCEIFSYS